MTIFAEVAKIVDVEVDERVARGFTAKPVEGFKELEFMPGEDPLGLREFRGATTGEAETRDGGEDASPGDFGEMAENFVGGGFAEAVEVVMVVVVVVVVVASGVVFTAIGLGFGLWVALVVVGVVVVAGLIDNNGLRVTCGIAAMARLVVLFVVVVVLLMSCCSGCCC